LKCYCAITILIHNRYVDEDEEEEGSNFDLSALDGGSQFGDEGGMGMGGTYYPDAYPCILYSANAAHSMHICALLAISSLLQ
jgi:hypothetical protein